MTTVKRVFPAVALSSAFLLTATLAVAASATRYLHVKVTNPTTHELVRVNVPLTLAAKRHRRDPRAVIEAFRALAAGGPTAAQVAAAAERVEQP